MESTIRAKPLDASEIKEATDFLESLAQALLNVHRLAGELSDARKTLGELLVSYGDTIRKRKNYETLVTDPQSTLQTYSAEYINRNCVAAASNFWEYLAVLDNTVALQSGREGRDLLLTLREFQKEYRQGSLFDVSLAEKKKGSSKKRHIFHRLKTSVSTGTNLGSKFIRLDPGVPVINDAATDIEALSNALRAMETTAVSRVITGLVQSTFNTIQDSINQGHVTKNVDACAKWNKYIIEKPTRQYSSTSAPETQDARASTPFDSGDPIYEATVDSGEPVTVSCSDDVTEKGYSDIHSGGSYYSHGCDKEGQSQLSPSIISQMDRPSVAKTEHTSRTHLGPSLKGSPSRGNSLETFRTSISRESVGASCNRGKLGQSSASATPVPGDASPSDVRRGSATSLPAPCPRALGHQRTRSVRTLPVLKGSGTASTNKRSFRRPRVPAVREEDVDGAMHETQRIPNRSKAYSVLGIKGKEIAKVERELAGLVPAGLRHCSVNASYRFPDRYGGSTWMGDTVEDGNLTMQFPKLSAQKEHAKLRRSSSYTAKASPKTSHIRRHSSVF